MDTSVWVTFAVPGIHYWDGADNYLQHSHRHLFKFRVELSVAHNDREVEFLALRDELEQVVRQRFLPNHAVAASCEHIAEMLVKYLKTNYPKRKYTVEVSEDGENGAKVSCDCRTCG